MQSKIFFLYAFTIIMANVLLLMLATKESTIFHTENSSDTILQKFDNVMGAQSEKEESVGRTIVPEHYLEP